MESFFTKHKQKLGIFFALILILSIAFFAQVFLSLLTQKFSLERDFTQKQIYQLAKETKHFLGELKEEVNVYVLTSEEEFTSLDDYFNHANILMKEMAKESSFLTLNYIDLNRNPNFLKNYPTSTIGIGDILITSKDGFVELFSYDLFHLTETTETVEIVGSKAESTLISRMLSLLSPDNKTVGFLSGNASYPLSSIEPIFSGNNYIVEEVDLLSPLPNHIDALFIFAPKEDLSSLQIKHMEDFMDKEDHLAIYISDNKQPDNLPQITGYLKKYGISLSSDLVIETNSKRTFEDNPYLMVTQYDNYTYAQKVPESASYPVLPFPMALEITHEPEGIVNERLLSFSSTAHVRPNTATEDWSPSEQSKNQNLAGMTLSQKKVGDKTSSLLVIPSASYFDNNVLGNGRLANGSYFITLLNTLTNRGDVMPISFTSFTQSSFQVTTQEGNLITFFFLFLLPLLMVITGFLIPFKRTRQK